MYIAAAAMKKVHFTGNLAKDRADFRNALATVKWTGATGPFKFVQAKNSKTGKLAGYDADQTPIISVTKGGQYTIVK